MRIFRNKIFSAIGLAFLLSGCVESQSVRNVSDECRYARADFQLCYGGCLSAQPGDFITAAAQCGRECKAESIYSAKMCR